MATAVAITAGLSAAQTLGVTATQLLALIRQNIASGLIDDGRLYLGVNSDGTAVTMAWADAIALDQYYQSQARVEASGGLVVQSCEFVS